MKRRPKHVKNGYIQEETKTEKNYDYDIFWNKKTTTKKLINK
jgi:hypothetical protein